MLVCALIRVATVSLPIIGVMKLDTKFLLMFLLKITYYHQRTRLKL